MCLNSHHAAPGVHEQNRVHTGLENILAYRSLEHPEKLTKFGRIHVNLETSRDIRFVWLEVIVQKVKVRYNKTVLGFDANEVTVCVVVSENAFHAFGNKLHQRLHVYL